MRPLKERKTEKKDGGLGRGKAWKRGEKPTAIGRGLTDGIPKPCQRVPSMVLVTVNSPCSKKSIKRLAVSCTCVTLSGGHSRKVITTHCTHCTLYTNCTHMWWTPHTHVPRLPGELHCDFLLLLPATSQWDFQERAQLRPECGAAMARISWGCSWEVLVEGMCKGPKDLRANWCDWYKRTQGRRSDQSRPLGFRGDCSREKGRSMF